MLNTFRIIFCLFLFLPTSYANTTAQERYYLWFDLGDVLVETREGLEQLRWMPGAYQMLEDAQSRGFLVGLISNVPEEWGEPDNLPSKIERLQEVLNSGWVDRHPMDLSRFDKILLPLRQAEAKPAPKLFLEALRHAEGFGKQSLFQGERAVEVEAAEDLGMFGHLINYSEDGSQPIYFPLEQLEPLRFGAELLSLIPEQIRFSAGGR